MYGRPGQEIPPNLRLVRRLREGGMGSVWLAENRPLATKVVVKFLSAEFAGNDAALRRFRREAAAAAQVKSEHVVKIFEHGVTSDGVPYIVMELLEGHDLDEHLLRRGPMSPQTCAQMIAQIAEALGDAHEKGIIHRDVKPENIFLCRVEGGQLLAKLLDFGIARAPQLDVGPATDQQTILGTPNYMSPEQMQGQPLDPRTDLWSLGLVAFEALTGKRAFPQSNFSQLAIAVVHAELPVPSDERAGLPGAVDAWFARACARKRDNRFASAKEMADALLEATSSDAVVEQRAEQRISRDELLTRFAKEATDLSVEFVKALGDLRIPPDDHYADLAPPEAPSTGAHATQQIRFLSKKPGAPSLKVGSVDVKADAVELRTHDHVNRLYRKRAEHGSIDRVAYERFLERARAFFEGMGMNVDLESAPEGMLPPAEADEKKTAWRLVALLVLGVGAAIAAFYFASR